MKNKLIACFFLFPLVALSQKREWMQPAELWPDQNGNHIQAHGGGITKIGKNY